MGIVDAPFAALDFIPVPEGKTVKNRIHIDLAADAIDPVIAYGAKVLRSPDHVVSWSVCTDPDGNEFCVFMPT